MKVLKLIVFNLLLLSLLVLIIDLGMAIYLEIGQWRSNSKIDETVNERAYLVNYENFEWAEDYYKEVEDLRSEYRSYFGWRKLPFKGKCINIDSNGLRRTIQYHKMPDSTKTVVFLGGSTTWGSGASDEFTIPSLFAQNSKGTFQSINYGEGGYCAYQSYLFFQIKAIEGVRPDLVISYDGVNNSPIRLPYFSISREKQIIERMKGADRKNSNDKFFLPSLRKLTNKAITNYVSSKNKINTRPEMRQTNRQAAIQLLESWKASLQMSKSIGSSFLCILQPNIFVGRPNTKNIEGLSFYDLHQELYKENGYAYYEEVLELIESTEYSMLKEHFLDLTKAFDDMENVYIDFCHVSPNGNDRIAQLILEHIEKS